jgi:drug/metabolite transporter (DMT)-like permease
VNKEESGRERYFLLLLLVNVMWAFQYSGAKIATQELGPIAVAFLPMLASTIMLGIILFVSQRGGRQPSSQQRGSLGKQVLTFVILGAGTFTAQLGLTSGVKRSLASNASVLTLVIPVLTALLATVMVGEKMNRLLWVSFALAIVGVLLVSDVDWRSVHLLRGKYLLGNALILVGCLGSAFYNTFSKRVLRLFTPLEVLVYSFIASDVVLFAAMRRSEPMTLRQLASIGPAAWASLAAIAVFPLTLAMLLFFWVIKRIALTKAALTCYLMPVFGVLISTVVVREKVRWQLLVGGIVVLAGTFLGTTYGERKKTEAAGQ